MEFMTLKNQKWRENVAGRNEVISVCVCGCSNIESPEEEFIFWQERLSGVMLSARKYSTARTDGVNAVFSCMAQDSVARRCIEVHHSERLVRSGYAVQSLDCSAQSQALYQNSRLQRECRRLWAPDTLTWS